MPQVFERYGKNLTITKPLTSTQNQIIRTVCFPTLSNLRSQGRLTYLHTTNSDEYDPFQIEQYHRTTFKMFSCCCICGSNDRVALHHINSLKSKSARTTDRYEKIRSELNKLQIPVCFSCHQDITHGRYNKASPKTYYDKFIAKL